MTFGLVALLSVWSVSLPLEAEASHEVAGQAVVSLDSSSGYNDQHFSLVLNDSGVIFASGSNNSGQLGTGDNFSSAKPRQVLTTGVLDGKTIVAVSSGARHALALDAEGSVYAWGENSAGQLGDGTTTNRNAPVVVNLAAVPSGSKIVKVVAGAEHSAAIDDQGIVYTWGENGDGRLGDGTTTRRTTPVSLSGAGALDGLKVTDVSLGGDSGYMGSGFTVAVSDTGTLLSWGANNDGQLGDGTTSQRTSPVLVDASGVIDGKTIQSISSGDRFTVALDSQGKAYSWGANNWGQLGDGSTTRRLSPVAVDVSGVLDGKELEQVAAGSEFVVSLDSTGLLFTWGLNSSGQLGDDSLTNRSVPVAVDTSTVLSGKTITAVAAGYRSTLVLDSEGSVHGWGLDSNGQLGVGLSELIRSPIAVTPAGALAGKTIQKTSFGYTHTLFIASDGLIYAVGQNGSRQLGDGTSTTALSTVLSGPSGGVLEGKTFTAVATGIYHSLALDSTGKVYSWGLNNHGQLGIGSTENADPTLVGGLLSTKTIVAIAAGGYHSLALDSDGVLYSWGYNVDGSLGVGDNTNRSSPVAVDMSGVLSGKTISTLHGGDRYSMVLDSAGQAYAWGSNSQGTLGDNTSTGRNVPVAVYTGGALSGKTITQLSTGMYHTLALDSAGAVYGWGFNSSGQLGDGTTSNRTAPTLINAGEISGKTMTSVAVGNNYSLAIDDEGVVYSWGDNYFGQLGLSDSSNRSTPKAVDDSGPLSGKTLTSLSTSFAGSASFAYDNEVALYGWGRNSNSDLSIGDTSKYVVAKTTLFSGHVPTVAVLIPPAPEVTPEPVAAPAPYSGPVVTSLSKFEVPENLKREIAIQGLRLDQVTSVTVDGLVAKILSSSQSSMALELPALGAGMKNLELISSLGKLIHQDAFNVVASRSLVTETSIDTKVNAGSFKGFVAIYAKGHEGKRLSAKVGKDWVIVPSLASGFERIVEFTGAGVAVSVKIYIDRVLTETVNLVTK